MTRVIATQVVVLLAACTHQTIPLPDSSSTQPDAGVAVRPPPPDHTCQPDFTDRDFYNCGACDAQCDPDNADFCEGGECVCGHGPACGEGEDCRFGRCVEVDLEGARCEFDDQCAAGFACIEGHCSRVNCVPEECDGIDNDCDGVIDGDERGPLAQWCISGGGSPAEVIAPCERGVSTCEMGGWSDCRGEVPPIEEVGTLVCDGIDNDCDGCADGVMNAEGLCEPATSARFDVLYIIDISGSMSDEIGAVTEATRSFSEEFSAGDWHFALAYAPGLVDRHAPQLIHDLTGYTEFGAALAIIPTTGIGGDEPTYDAVWEAMSGDLGVTWRPGAAKIIIVFTDEEGQSHRARYSLPAIDERDICDARTGEVLAAVVDPRHASGFDDCMSVFELSNDAVEMVTHLRSIIRDPCD